MRALATTTASQASASTFGLLNSVSGVFTIRPARLAGKGQAAGSRLELKSAGEALTARRAPRRPGTAPALGLRASSDALFIRSQAIRARNRKARRPMLRKLLPLSAASVLI